MRCSRGFNQPSLQNELEQGVLCDWGYTISSNNAQRSCHKVQPCSFHEIVQLLKKDIQSAEITSHEVCHNTTENQSSFRGLTQGEFISLFFVPLCQIHFYLVRIVGDLPCVIKGFMSK